MIQGSTLSNMAGSNCVPTLRPTRLHHIYKHSPPSPPSPLASFPPPCRSTSPFTHSSSTSFPSQLQNKLWLFLSFLFLPRPDLVASHYKHTLLLFVALLIFLLLLLIILIFCLLYRLLLSSTFFSPLLSPLALISAFASKTNLSSLSPCPMPKSKSAHHIHIWQCHSTSSHLNHHTSTNMHQMRFKSRTRALKPEVQRSLRFLIQDNKAGRQVVQLNPTFDLLAITNHIPFGIDTQVTGQPILPSEVMLSEIKVVERTHMICAHAYKLTSSQKNIAMDFSVDFYICQKSRYACKHKKCTHIKFPSAH